MSSLSDLSWVIQKAKMSPTSRARLIQSGSILAAFDASGDIAVRSAIDNIEYVMNTDILLRMPDSIVSFRGSPILALQDVIQTYDARLTKRAALRLRQDVEVTTNVMVSPIVTTQNMISQGLEPKIAVTQAEIATQEAESVQNVMVSPALTAPTEIEKAIATKKAVTEAQLSTQLREDTEEIAETLTSDAQAHAKGEIAKRRRQKLWDTFTNPFVLAGLAIVGGIIIKKRMGGGSPRKPPMKNLKVSQEVKKIVGNPENRQKLKIKVIETVEKKGGSGGLPHISTRSEIAVRKVKQDMKNELERVKEKDLPRDLEVKAMHDGLNKVLKERSDSEEEKVTKKILKDKIEKATEKGMSAEKTTKAIQQVVGNPITLEDGTKLEDAEVTVDEIGDITYIDEDGEMQIEYGAIDNPKIKWTGNMQTLKRNILIGLGKIAPEVPKEKLEKELDEHLDKKKVKETQNIPDINDMTSTSLKIFETLAKDEVNNDAKHKSDIELIDAEILATKSIVTKRSLRRERRRLIKENEKEKKERRNKIFKEAVKNAEELKKKGEKFPPVKAMVDSWKTTWHFMVYILRLYGSIQLVLPLFFKKNRQWLLKNFVKVAKEMTNATVENVLVSFKTLKFIYDLLPAKKKEEGMENLKELSKVDLNTVLTKEPPDVKETQLQVIHDKLAPVLKKKPKEPGVPVGKKPVKTFDKFLGKKKPVSEYQDIELKEIPS